MKALICESYGPPENLRFADISTPDPKEGQVRIQMCAAGVNYPDALLIQDKYQYHPTLPFSPGGEVAGIVDAIGAGVVEFKLGDRISSLTTYGAFAEYVIADACKSTSVPEAMSLHAAGGFTVTYGTAHYALKQRGQLLSGETVLVLGAGGGVGLAAVDIAKVLGARVIAAASSEDKLAVAKQYGADETINYGDANLRDAVRAVTGGRGVDVIMDPVGDRFADPAFRSMAWGGRYLVIGFAGGAVPSIPLNLPLLKGASIVGVFWGDFVAREPALHRQNMQELYDWYVNGKLRPIMISGSYALRDGAAAIRQMMDRKARGKLILTTADE